LEEEMKFLLFIIMAAILMGCNSRDADAPDYTLSDGSTSVNVYILSERQKNKYVKEIRKEAFKGDEFLFPEFKEFVLSHPHRHRYYEWNGPGYVSRLDSLFVIYLSFNLETNEADAVYDWAEAHPDVEVAKAAIRYEKDVRGPNWLRMNPVE